MGFVGVRKKCNLTEESIEMILQTLQKKKRNCISMYDKVWPTYNNREFKTHFRISKSLFEVLVRKFENSKYFPERMQGGGRVQIDGNKHLLAFLWYVGHRGPTFRDVADRFDASLEGLSEIINRVNSFLYDMSKFEIHWPDITRKEEIKEQFLLKSGFPNVIGCVDGTHIRIDAPAENATAYFNRKKFYSIQVQAICDDRKKFLDVFIGYPGSVHDARVYRNCALYPTLPLLCTGGYILGDSAYPLSTWCLVPYKDNGHLTTVQRNYNKKHSSARIAIEHAFGLLKQRFLILKYVPLRKIDKICSVIMSCCVLHNLVADEELEEFDIEEDEMDISTTDSDESVAEHTSSAEAADLRNHIATVLL